MKLSKYFISVSRKPRLVRAEMKRQIQNSLAEGETTRNKNTTPVRARILILDWKKLLLVLLAEPVAIVLHNLVGALLGVEEALFFILAIFIIPLYLLAALIYSAYNLTKPKSKKSKK